MTATMTPDEIATLHDDARRSAEIAKLTYVLSDAPGLSRARSGAKGWRYTDAGGKPLTDVETKKRIAALAIPPAWQKVWINPDPDGHILATGDDAKGRKQYIYHPRWRALRDMLNFYRLLVFAGHLGLIRKHVDAQLRRRTLDRDQILALMIRIIDESYIRIGNEVYAEENHSFGLSTLTSKHVTVKGDHTHFLFPAKSNKEWDVTMDDARVARKMQKLLDVAKPNQRIFAVDGGPIDSDEVNEVLHDVTGEHLTAKDFRTWGGTTAAFEYLRDRLDDERAGRSATADKKLVNKAIDAAAEELGNTRSVARAHYVHPHVLETFTEHTFADYLDQSKPTGGRQLSSTERQLTGFLTTLLDTEFASLREQDR